MSQSQHLFGNILFSVGSQVQPNLSRLGEHREIRISNNRIPREIRKSNGEPTEVRSHQGIQGRLTTGLVRAGARVTRPQTTDIMAAVKDDGGECARREVMKQCFGRDEPRWPGTWTGG